MVVSFRLKICKLGVTIKVHSVFYQGRAAGHTVGMLVVFLYACTYSHQIQEPQ